MIGARSLFLMGGLGKGGLGLGLGMRGVGDKDGGGWEVSFLGEAGLDY